MDAKNFEIRKRYLDSVRVAKFNVIVIACRVKELKTTSKKLIVVYQIMLLNLMKKLLNN